MLPLATRFRILREGSPGVFKVVSASEAATGTWPLGRCVIDEGGDRSAETLRTAVAGVIGDSDHGVSPEASGWWLSEPERGDVVKAGDVIRLTPGRRLVSVLWRRGANANSLFATGRCNSLCLMCSQPPTPEVDDWRLAELLHAVALIDRDERQLGVTGGEPTLLEGLPLLIAACRDRLPSTRLHILTNGRRFASEDLVARMARLAHPDLVWAVPIYGDLPELHDWVVQAKGAFAETLAGLYHLALWRQRVEVRVVLHRPTVERLPDIAAFIARTLPFVEHVALMGLEPIGYARSNHEMLKINPLACSEQLAEACWHLANRGMNVSIYNLPFCVLPDHLWRFARRSISDWKNDFAVECKDCTGRDACAGFFAWSTEAERRARLRPLKPEAYANAFGEGGNHG